jgi:aminoglycoside phosphotransferase (APT) family kinase protein
VVRWFEGEIATPANSDGLTESLAAFLVALHEPAPPDVPANPFRQSLPARASIFAEHLAHVHHAVDASAAGAVFDAAARIPAWREPPVWIHADLHPANVIVGDGRLRAVVDFGDLAAGDPAVDLAIAWMLWPQRGRKQFRDAVDRASGRTDDATWRRARGWALALGVTFLANSDDHPTMGAIGRRTVNAVLNGAE